MELVGSWTVEVGDMDQALHLWQYNGGFQVIDKAQSELSKDDVKFHSLNGIRIKSLQNIINELHLLCRLTKNYSKSVEIFWGPGICNTYWHSVIGLRSTLDLAQTNMK